MDVKKVQKEPFGIVKTASIRTFLQCADYLVKNGNKPTRPTDLKQSGASIFMVTEFLDFGMHFGLVDSIQSPGSRRLTYALSSSGLEFYKPLLAWEKKLRSKLVTR